MQDHGDATPRSTVRRRRGLRWRTVGLVAATAVVVSPLTAWATSRFNDVSDTHAHAAGIAWVDEVGVTAGCTTTNYCPGNAVTRAQMATFLRRLAGADPNVAPSVDAATVQGLGPDQLGGGLGEVVMETRGPALVPAGGTQGFAIPCEDGSIVSGGASGGPGIQVNSSHPMIDGDTHLWVVTLHNGGASAVEVTGYAVCTTS